MEGPRVAQRSNSKVRNQIANKRHSPCSCQAGMGTVCQSDFSSDQDFLIFCDVNPFGHRMKPMTLFSVCFKINHIGLQKKPIILKYSYQLLKNPKYVP